MNINPNMFGSSEAARNLAEMVADANNPIYLRKVARFLNNQAAMVKTLNEIPYLHQRRALAKMVKRSILEANMDLPEKMKTHTINVAVGQLRRAMESWEEPDLDQLPLYPDSPEFNFIKEAVAETRRLDAEDVRSGKLKPEDLHFISPEMARASKPVFPERYRKS